MAEIGGAISWSKHRWKTGDGREVENIVNFQNNQGNVKGSTTCAEAKAGEDSLDDEFVLNRKGGSR